MAVSVYYGTCITDATTAEKVVRINSSEINTNDFNFEIGDLLVVYFSYMNNVSAPSLKVINGDTEEEVSTSNDTGKFVKINSIEKIKDPIGLWDNGETVVFAYTKNVNNNDNTYYWELIDSARASEIISGVTKLYGNANTNVSKWIGDDLQEEDFEKALTPGILKKFYKLLVGDITESTSPAIRLNWNPANLEGDLITLGKLSLNTEENSGIDITFPLDKYIDDRIGQVVEKTSDIVNDGPDPSKNNLNTDGHFYITNIIPRDKSFYYSYKEGNVDKTYRYLTPNNDTGNLVLRSPNTIFIRGNGSNGVRIDSDSGDSKLTVQGDISSKAITASGKIKEKNELLEKRYCGAYKITTVKKSNITIPKNSTTKHLEVPSKDIDIYPGYTPIGIVGVNLDYYSKKDTGAATWCFLWEHSLIRSNKTIQFAIRNTNTSRAVTVNARFDVLYFRTSF